MTDQPVQRTRFQLFLDQLGGSLLSQLRSSWRGGSLALLALLIGFFGAQNLTTWFLLSAPGGRPAVVLAFVLLVELMVRLRGRWVRGDPSLAWVVVDNLRVGAVYSVVLEAFKVGT